MYDSPHVQNQWVRVNGLRIYYRYSEGDGLPIVLLQGGMLDSSTLTWRYVLEGLPPQERVFAPDLPGYGKSDKPKAPYTTGYFIDFIERFLDTLGLERVILFGSSMSGAVALGFAFHAPERVAALGLSGAYGWQPSVPLHPLAYLAAHLPGLPQLVRRLLLQGPAVMRQAMRIAVPDPTHITDELVADACAGLTEPGQLEAFAAWMRHELTPTTVRSNYADRLQDITVPVLILHGGHDWMMPVTYARRAHERLPCSSLHIFPDSGHLVPREYPEEVNCLIKTFLETLDQPSREQGLGTEAR